MAQNHSDHSDANEEEEFPPFDEDITDSEQEPWPDDTDSETDLEVDDEPVRTSGSSTSSASNYGYLILIVGAIVLAALPVWFQSPNGFTLIKESLMDAHKQGNCKSALGKNERLFTKNELANYKKPPKILLAFLGVVYDVSDGQYYHPDGSYHFFAGKDGTRGFLTGEFTESELVDDISDLDDSYLNGVDTWLSLYKDKYERVGLLVGAYYNSSGCETRKLRQVLRKIENAKSSQEDSKADEQKYPPCNSEWAAEEKRGRVWCSKQSGGVARSWVGHPRQFYVLSAKNWRCACVQDDSEVQSCDRPNDLKSPGVKYAQSEGGQPDTPNCLFKHYSNCDPAATECPFQD